MERERTGSTIRFHGRKPDQSDRLGDAARPRGARRPASRAPRAGGEGCRRHRPPALRRGPSPEPAARDVARRLPLGGHRGVRAAHRRGDPRGEDRVGHPGRRARGRLGRTPGARTRGGAAATALRPRTGRPRPAARTARPVAAGDDRGAGRDPRRRAVPARRRCAGGAGRAGRLPVARTLREGGCRRRRGHARRRRRHAARGPRAARAGTHGGPRRGPVVAPHAPGGRGGRPHLGARPGRRARGGRRRAGRGIRPHRRARRARDARAPVPGRRGSDRGAAGPPDRLGARVRRGRDRRRLRRRVPLRPPADRRAAGDGARPGRAGRQPQQDRDARPRPRLAGAAAVARRAACATRGPRRRRRSTSSHSPAFSPQAASTATCGPPAPAIGGGARRCSRRSNARCPSAACRASRRDSTSCSTSPRASARRTCVRLGAARDVALTDIRRYRVSPDAPAPEQLVLGYGDLADPLVDEAVALLAAAVREAAARGVGGSR